MEKLKSFYRGGSRTAATSEMEHFVIIVNGWKPLTIITKCSILDVAAALDPPLLLANLYDKKKNVIHIRNLKQALNHRLELIKLHAVIRFNQETWLKQYIDMTTELKKSKK